MDDLYDLLRIGPMREIIPTLPLYRTESTFNDLTRRCEIQPRLAQPTQKIALALGLPSRAGQELLTVRVLAARPVWGGALVLLDSRE